MKGYKKDDIEIYYDRSFRGGKPSVNVKAYDFGRGLSEDDFPNCSEETFERAMEFAFEMAQENFWSESAQELCDNYLQRGKVFAAGRQSGHLIVDGLDPVETWNAIMVNKWALFERAIRKTIKYLSSKATIKENIDANKWYEEGAEQYNFIDTKEGNSLCISGLKKQAQEQGFGPVIRL